MNVLITRCPPQVGQGVREQRLGARGQGHNFAKKLVNPSGQSSHTTWPLIDVCLSLLAFHISDWSQYCSLLHKERTVLRVYTSSCSYSAHNFQGKAGKRAVPSILANGH